jgi:hypothetical protein
MPVPVPVVALPSFVLLVVVPVVLLSERTREESPSVSRLTPSLMSGRKWVLDVLPQDPVLLKAWPRFGLVGSVMGLWEVRGTRQRHRGSLRAQKKGLRNGRYTGRVCTLHCYLITEKHSCLQRNAAACREMLLLQRSTAACLFLYSYKYYVTAPVMGCYSTVASYLSSYQYRS